MIGAARHENITIRVEAGKISCLHGDDRRGHLKFVSPRLQVANHTSKENSALFEMKSLTFVANLTKMGQ